MTRRALLAALLAPLPWSCGGDMVATGADTTLAGDVVVDGDGGPLCQSFTTTYATVPSPHVTTCSAVSYDSNPPTSGPHYPVWAAFQRYDAPVPRGFLVHSMEHGAVVVFYDCDGDPCDAELAALNAYLASRAPDPACPEDVGSRFIVVPDPALGTRFAAAAWGNTLRSTCFDLAALADFIDAHYARGPEDLCAPGIDVFDPDAAIPDDCGE